MLGAGKSYLKYSLFSLAYCCICDKSETKKREFNKFQKFYWQQEVRFLCFREFY